jgi:hypothetical protein
MQNFKKHIAIWLITFPFSGTLPHFQRFPQNVVLPVADEDDDDDADDGEDDDDDDDDDAAAVARSGHLVWLKSLNISKEFHGLSLAIMDFHGLIVR